MREGEGAGSFVEPRRLRDDRTERDTFKNTLDGLIAQAESAGAHALLTGLPSDGRHVAPTA